ncbi:hypothetical protein BSLG_001778 [Batrachochytrium salamandrivorans]|nr:hypothetical protein BSLG_001778 [Batrachochytrium salamandrivorans]
MYLAVAVVATDPAEEYCRIVDVSDGEAIILTGGGSSSWPRGLRETAVWASSETGACSKLNTAGDINVAPGGVVARCRVERRQSRRQVARHFGIIDSAATALVVAVVDDASPAVLGAASDADMDTAEPLLGLTSWYEWRIWFPVKLVEGR